jgi:Gas vesicle protein
VTVAIERRSGTTMPGHPRSDSLADVLERVLDKGIVIAGDIQINLLEIELLTIRLRLLIASVDKAKEMGIDWWESDPGLNGGQRRLADENQRLRERLDSMERQLARLEPGRSETESRSGEERDG